MKTTKQRWEAIWETTWALPLICGLIALAALLVIGFLGVRFFPELLEKYNEYFAGIAAGVSAVVVAVLVGVTIMYARAAKKQADASVEMAKEMMEGRLSEAQPYLLLRLNLEKDELLQWEDYESKRRPTEFPVTIHNAGKGPAINLWAALWHRKNTYFAGVCKGFLAPGEEWQSTISRLDTRIPHKEGWLPQLRELIKSDDPGTVAVEYEDIHERRWVSYLCLERHVDVDALVMEGKQKIVEVESHD